MVFTETWLHSDIPDSLCEIEGFSLIRADRTEASGKSRGGGVCIYINDNWCRNYAVRQITCTPDVELLCLSLRPGYLPREFGNIFLCAVYVPPSGNAASAAAFISDCVQQQLRRCPEAPGFHLRRPQPLQIGAVSPEFSSVCKMWNKGRQSPGQMLWEREERICEKDDKGYRIHL
ncbi:uncharacterized protein LOC144037518 [Vanacampus margaritifer]